MKAISAPRTGVHAADRAERGSKIRCARRGNRSLRAEEERVLCADCFRPVAYEAPIGDPSRPGHGENAWVLHHELNLQALLGGVRVNGAASIGGGLALYVAPCFRWASAAASPSIRR